MTVHYLDNTADIVPDQLHGFFVGWPDPPSAQTHLRLLRQSTHVLLAIDAETNAVVGFITAITDGVLCAYIPLLEVLPAYQGGGIGQELVHRMLQRLEGYYMIDLLCDAELQPYYTRLGMQPVVGMCRRNYARQSADGMGEQKMVQGDNNA